MGGPWHSPMVIRHFHISHNAPYPPPPNPPPKKICITFVFHFSWVLQPSQEKLKTILMQTFFGRGCGGEQIRCIMGNVEVLKARRPWGRGWRICWFSVEKRQNGGWITQNELRGHSTPSSKSSIVKMIWTLIMRRQRPTYQTYTLILFNETNSQAREDWARFSRLG